MKKIIVRILACFIFNQKKRRNFRKRHFNIHNTSIVHNVLLLSSDIIIMDKVELQTNFKNSIIIDEGVRIGRGCTISNHNKNGIIKIGKNTQIGFYNNYYGQGGIEIGNNVITASYVCILSSNHGFEDINIPIMYQPSSYKKVFIDDDTWIGYNVIILPGVHIGKHCVIVAGSVVTKDMPDYSVCAGNPCRVIKKYNSKTKKWEKIK